jgi:GTP cyclohydrolase II
MLHDGFIVKELNHWCDLPTPMGTFRMYDSGTDCLRIISFGDINVLKNETLLRIHSSCIASEVFGAKDCDCADQLREAMKLIAHEQGGLIVHLNQEGRGQGLSKKIKAINLMQSQGLDTVEAFDHLKYEQDVRSYLPVIILLNRLAIDSVRLISNNPKKISFLKGSGILVSTVNTHPNIRPENIDYLATKNKKLGHILPLESQLSGTINFYHSDQPWGDLSNFSKHAIYLKNKIWPTVEHYYQAQKFSGTEHEETIRRSENPTLAKQIARDIPSSIVRPDWSTAKQEVMLNGLEAKFLQHPELSALLVSSGSRPLVEHTKNDNYWGDGGDGTGQNILGKLLMKVRENLVTKVKIKHDIAR